MKDNLHPVFGWPDIVRFSWGPAKEVMDKEPAQHRACTVLWADDDEADTSAEQQRSAMAAFLGKVKKLLHGIFMLRPQHFVSFIDPPNSFI